MTWLIVIALVVVFFVQFTSMYYAQREKENRDLSKELDLLRDEVARLRNDNRILRARLGEPEDETKLRL